MFDFSDIVGGGVLVDHFTGVADRGSGAAEFTWIIGLRPLQYSFLVSIIVRIVIIIIIVHSNRFRRRCRVGCKVVVVLVIASKVGRIR